MLWNSCKQMGLLHRLALTYPLAMSNMQGEMRMGQKSTFTNAMCKYSFKDAFSGGGAKQESDCNTDYGDASCEPARLNEGHVLGQLSPVTMAIATNEEDTRNKPDNLVSTLVTPNQDTPNPVQRTQQLLEDLQPESETLSEEEKEKWRVFLTEYNHLFTLNKSELAPPMSSHIPLILEITLQFDKL